MELTIDKFGRVLIPKEIRNLLGLVPGTKVKVEVDKNYGRLSLATDTLPAPQIIEFTDWGFPYVNNGEPDTDEFDTVAFMKETYDEYFMRKLGF